MSAKTAINKEVFTPHDERMLVAVQVKRRTKKKIPFLATGGQGDYMTFICVSAASRSSPFPSGPLLTVQNPHRPLSGMHVNCGNEGDPEEQLESFSVSSTLPVGKFLPGGNPTRTLKHHMLYSHQLTLCP